MSAPWLRALDAVINGSAWLALEVMFPSVPPQRRAEVEAHAKADPIRSVPINQAEWVEAVATRIAREEAKVWNDWAAVCRALDAWIEEA